MFFEILLTIIFRHGLSWCQRYVYMIADEGFSESFNKCWQNIQMNFSFSHTGKKFFCQSGIAILSIDSRNPHVEVFSLRKSYKDCLLCLTFIGCGLPWKYLFSIHLPFCTLIGRIWPFHQLCWNLLGNSLDAHPSLQGMMRWYAMHDAICQICVLLIKVEKSIMLNLCSFA